MTDSNTSTKILSAVPPDVPTTGKSKTRVISKQAEKGRLSSAYLRARYRANDLLNEFFAPLAQIHSDAIAITFPRGGTGIGNLAAWLTEADIVRVVPASEPSSPHDSQSPPPGSMVLAQLRLVSGHKIQNVLPISDLGMTHTVRIAEKVLTFLLRHIEFKLGSTVFLQKDGLNDDVYTAVKIAEAEICSAYVHNMAQAIARGSLASSSSSLPSYSVPLSRRLSMPIFRDDYIDYAFTLSVPIQSALDAIINEAFRDCPGEFRVYFVHEKGGECSLVEYVSELKVFWFPTWQAKYASVFSPAHDGFGIAVLTAVCDSDGEYRFSTIVADDEMHNRIGKIIQILLAWQCHLGQVFEAELRKRIKETEPIRFFRFLSALLAELPTIRTALSGIQLQEHWFAAESG